MSGAGSELRKDQRESNLSSLAEALYKLEVMAKAELQIT